MKRRTLQIVFLVLSVLLIAVLSAGATKTPTRQLKHASGPITALAMDGPRVVYSTDGNGVYVWNIRSGLSSRVRRPSRSSFPVVQEVAIAGGRVAWITRAAFGNSHETWENLYTASRTGQGRVHLASAFRRDGESDTGVQLWTGKWIGGLVGSGNLLAVSRWGTVPNADESGLTVSNARLSLITAKRGLRVIASGEQSIVSSAADAGRIAVLRQDGSVGIFSAAGALLRQIMPSSAQEIALGGGHLVVLTKTKTLEVYNPQSGALEHSWPIKTTRAYLQVGHLQAYGRIALFVVDPRYSSHNLTIFDLKTGKRLFLPWGPRSARNDATVGSLGIVYAANSYKNYGGHHASGTLVFLSTTRVLAAFARGHL